MEDIQQFFASTNADAWLIVAYVIVTILIGIMAVAALVMWLMVMIRYLSTNNKKLSTGKTATEVARETLDKCGLNYVKVKKANFLRAWFFGNSYSLSQKTVFLRRNIADKSSVTAIGMALQKVGVAKMCEKDGGLAKTRNTLQVIGLFGPFMFLPLIIIGALIDVFMLQTDEFGIFSAIGLILGILFLVAGFVVTLLNIPVEKKANDMALEMIDESGLMNETERAEIKKLFDTFMIAYVLDFILTVLRIIQLILQIIIQSRAKND